MASSAPSPRPSIFERRASRRYGTPDAVPPVPAIDPEAAHVSDPATRLKLKLYLGSAAKFDEAIEFGFPATTAQTPPASAMSTTRRGSMSSAHSRRRSHSISTTRPSKRQSTIVGATFFRDDDDDESFTIGLAYSPDHVVELASPKSPGMGDDIHTFFAELPADDSSRSQLRPSITTPQTAPAHVQHVPDLPAPAYTRASHRSQSISLRPHQPLALDTAVAQLHNVRPLISAREKPLRPWIEPTETFGEREMTLRLTLTRKDLRADENLIYPENGAGSWDVLDQDATIRSYDNKWRFWQRRR